ncbi:MAG TPA: SDR family NAD(P)-dependent oxidoreductase [Ktedonobacteraceae bacterium]|nr:SDR family NAD(P)-dependent oxidoreductase [Ktedonobacteraceae bacterium]
MAKKLAGKVALVTGASSGIGEATAIALAEEGARVAALARRSDHLEKVVKRIKDAGGEAVPIVADVTNEAQLREAIRRVKETFGRIDILVNNAGVMLLGKIEGTDTGEWRQMLDINVLAVMLACHEILPIMKAQGGGHIVNISSVAGRQVKAGYSGYNASKWAVGAFSESLRQEVTRQHIRVTVIEPGMVATELRQHITDPEVRKAQEDAVRSGTPLQGEDVAAVIVFAVTRPEHVSISEILVRPTDQV